MSEASVEGHYEQQLERSLRTPHALMITLAGVSPALTVFAYIPVLLWVCGTWSFWATLIAGAVAIGMAFVYAEVATAFPTAGGEYAIVGRVLGRGAGFVVYCIFLVMAVLIMATFAVGAGRQLQVVWSGVDFKIAGLISLAIAALLSIPTIKFGSIINGVLFVVQIIAIAIISFVGFAHVHAPSTRLFELQGANPDGSSMVFTWSVFLLGLTLAFFNITGFNMSVYFSEEIEDARKRLVRVLLLAAGCIFLMAFVPLTAMLLGAPSLTDLFANPAPPQYLMESYGAGRLATFVNLLVYVAIFNALIANTLGFGRVLWSGMRDKALPAPISRLLTTVHPRFKTPWVACLVIAALGAAAMYSSTLTGLVTLTGFITIVFMALIAISGLRIRFMKDVPTHYKMPLWPVPPIAVLVAFILMATGQTKHDLYIVIGVIVVAVVYFLAYLMPRSKTNWVMLGAVEEAEPETEPATTASAAPTAT